MPNYHNGVPEIQIFGNPKTVDLKGSWRGETHVAPLECWIYSLVETLSPEQKDVFFKNLKVAIAQRDSQRLRREISSARVVAEIPMPNFDPTSKQR